MNKMELIKQFIAVDGISKPYLEGIENLVDYIFKFQIEDAARQWCKETGRDLKYYPSMIEFIEWHKQKHSK